ncbi:hypothetical protein RUM44_009383 [Polyplax serrata]|uniref:Uncharacterized protein n=1 Tax=Polyplax serrata TaxID=468196 RepID=A0ABR1ASL1_POLSC
MSEIQVETKAIKLWPAKAITRMGKFPSLILRLLLRKTLDCDYTTETWLLQVCPPVFLFNGNLPPDRVTASCRIKSACGRSNPQSGTTNVVPASSGYHLLDRTPSTGKKGRVLAGQGRVGPSNSSEKRYENMGKFVPSGEGKEQPSGDGKQRVRRCSKRKKKRVDLTTTEKETLHAHKT